MATSNPELSPAADAAFKVGAAMYELKRWDVAASALLLAARLGDGRSQVMHGVGMCARNLVAKGALASEQALPSARARGRISVIVCSITPDKLARLEKNLGERLAQEDWELIHIGDALSLCDGYNRGRERASGELLVFCHDDIRILSPNFADKLRAYLAEYDLIGVAGTTKATGPDWAWSGAPHLHCWISQPHFVPQAQHLGPVTLLMGARGPVVADAQLLDGVFLAAHRDLVDRIGFDAVHFDGFHFYDLDFSYRAHLAGAKTAICMDICLFHESAGDFSASYEKYAQRFCTKFPEACSELSTPAPRDIPWIPRAQSDDVLLQELAWLSHWLMRSDGELVSKVRAATTTLSTLAPGADGSLK